MIFYQEKTPSSIALMDHLLEDILSLYQLSGSEVTLVWVMGVEPIRPKPQKPKSCTSTNFVIPRYGAGEGS